MRSRNADRESRLSLWRRVREFAVPPSMIEAATARRQVGDWAGACAAARVDLDLRLRSVARTRGVELAARLRADLRRLAPDLLRWHLPRIAPHGLLRPGLTIALARYDLDDGGPVHLVARTAPAWADAGQRISLAVWDGTRTGSPVGTCPHPHPRPDRRFRLDLHRHLWDANRAGELRTRSGADRRSGYPAAHRQPSGNHDPIAADLRERGYAVDRWAAEAAILLRADGGPGGPVEVRLGSGRQLLLDPETIPPEAPEAPEAPETPEAPEADVALRPAPRRDQTLPVLPDAATRIPPDLELLEAGLIVPDRLHPLVARALAPGHRQSTPEPRAAGNGRRLVECRGALHRIGLVDGVLVALDHDPAEIRREELLAALTGTPLPCLQTIDLAHRSPECLDDIRARLEHGDTAGAVAAVEELIGPEALLRDGALRDELEEAALRRIEHGLYRAGLIDPDAARAARAARADRTAREGRAAQPARRTGRARPRHASTR